MESPHGRIALEADSLRAIAHVIHLACNARRPRRAPSRAAPTTRRPRAPPRPCSRPRLRAKFEADPRARQGESVAL